MDFHLKQWRNQHVDESDQQQQQPSAPKMPKLLLDQHHHQQHSSASSTALPLFAPEPNCTNKVSTLSAFPDHLSPSATTTIITTSPRFTRMESYFSLAQIEELQLQALIYRYMLAGAAVPPKLLQPIKKSLLHSTPYFLHHPLSHYSYCQPTWYWGRGTMDPEPGRCRRTDGKKWRCSRDVVAGQKYCERHVHRGRNRSRKPVEIPTPSSTTTTTATGIGGGSGGGGGAAAGSLFNSSSTTTLTAGSSLSTVASGTNMSLSRHSHDSIDLLHLNHSCSDSKTESKGLLGTATQNDHVGDKPDGHVLRHFFDDWPRSLQEPDCNAGSNASPLSSATCLSISVPGNSPSDVSLKLSTGNGEEDPSGGRGRNEREQPLLNWGGSGWGTNQVSSMGGPLAEALRSSVSNSSSTNVLHQLPRGSASEASYVIT